MTSTPARCLILACGNTLRGDDGIGLWLADWAGRRFAGQAGVRILARQQWTPELSEDVARAESVLFIDCSVDSEPGSVRLRGVEAASGNQGLATHHQGAAELLALAHALYDSSPRNAQLLTVGAGSTELGETFSGAVRSAMPGSCRLIEETVLRWLGEPERPKSGSGI
jgi:hydrogenase maturation protease